MFNIQRMQKVFAMIVLLCCAAYMGRANEAPPVWINDAVTNVMKIYVGNIIYQI